MENINILGKKHIGGPKKIETRLLGWKKIPEEIVWWFMGD